MINERFRVRYFDNAPCAHEVHPAVQVEPGEGRQRKVYWESTFDTRPAAKSVTLPGVAVWWRRRASRVLYSSGRGKFEAQLKQMFSSDYFTTQVPASACP